MHTKCPYRTIHRPARALLHTVVLVGTLVASGLAQVPAPTSPVSVPAVARPAAGSLDKLRTVNGLLEPLGRRARGVEDWEVISAARPYVERTGARLSCSYVTAVDTERDVVEFGPTQSPYGPLVTRLRNCTIEFIPRSRGDQFLIIAWLGSDAPSPPALQIDDRDVVAEPHPWTPPAGRTGYRVVRLVGPVEQDVVRISLALASGTPARRLPWYLVSVEIVRVML